MVGQRLVVDGTMRRITPGGASAFNTGDAEDFFRFVALRSGVDTTVIDSLLESYLQE